MVKNHQINHEYYANAETCRNRWFDLSDGIQNEDFHLNVPDETEWEDESDGE